jgi:hypothetical protein
MNQQDQLETNDPFSQSSFNENSTETESPADLELTTEQAEQTKAGSTWSSSLPCNFALPL